MAPQPDIESAQQTVELIFNVLEEGSKKEYLGEDISQLEHSLQTAQQARDAQADNETVLAALLHDIGQFCDRQTAMDIMAEASDLAGKTTESTSNVKVGVKGHEYIGGQYLRRLGFSEKVAQLVEAHVVAKRYLTAMDQAYYDGLSSASKASLKYQGGPFSAEQVKEFESDPLFREKVQLRLWDDKAKVVGLDLPGLESYKDIAVQHLIRSSA
ncbi:2-amino-1-hydroxyethylphosphonate dioxygenase (glycine-forming) [Entomortierella parvispora]|uniref:2-amino-1-hydroxyethylphosphonate dioxygenase (Glycine-forming) n=1 Tax=Entomortierella parvispora TaxID=205924 RepID=A0A9P3LUV8_9FUNG|nr:2-amino-1-hydroxyethylphosphonate dioxygenase (glycine-forming) [Entomortierella parvispora]